MRTVHIHTKSKLQSLLLMHKICRSCLVNNENYITDTSFHFLVEPDLVIRVADPWTLVKIRQYLKDRDWPYKTEEYPYPLPLRPGQFGESELGIMTMKRRFIMMMMNAESKAALTMDAHDHQMLMERIIHTAYNMRGLNRWQECRRILQILWWRFRTALKYGG